MKSFSKVLLLCCFTAVIHISKSSTPCPSLSITPGAVISCEVPSQNKKIPCTGPMQTVPKGTIAKYKCEGDSDFSENVAKCICRGKWKGLNEFQNFTSSCATTQHSFSLNGPPELNLTKEEIQNLDGGINSNNSININENFTGYAWDALAYHNYYRKLHGAHPLVLNSSLSEAAMKWAEHEVSENKFETEPWSINKSYISNIYLLTGSGDFDPSMGARLAVGRWYISGSGYDYDVPVANAFSAMIWNSTTDLGIGVAQKDGNVMVVANYWPPGNVYVVGGDNNNDSLSLFRNNVYPPLNSTVGENKTLSQ